MDPRTVTTRFGWPSSSPSTTYTAKDGAAKLYRPVLVSAAPTYSAIGTYSRDRRAATMGSAMSRAVPPSVVKVAVQVRRGIEPIAYAVTTSAPLGSGTSGQSSGRGAPVSFHFLASWRARSSTAVACVGVGDGDPIVGRACGSGALQPPSTRRPAHTATAALVVPGVPMGQR